MFKELHETATRYNLYRVVEFFIVTAVALAIAFACFQFLVLPLLSLVFGSPSFSGWSLGPLQVGPVLNTALYAIALGVTGVCAMRLLRRVLQGGGARR